MLLLLLSRFSRFQLCATPYMAAHQAPPSLGFSRQEHWSGLPFPSPMHESEKWKWICSVVSDSQRPHGLQPTRLLRPWDFPGKCTGVGCYRLLQSLGINVAFLFWDYLCRLLGFPGGSVDKEHACNAGDGWWCGFDLWVGEDPRGGHDNTLQYSCLENPRDSGTWWATVHGVTKSQTQLSLQAHAGSYVGERPIFHP